MPQRTWSLSSGASWPYYAQLRPLPPRDLGNCHVLSPHSGTLTVVSTVANRTVLHINILVYLTFDSLVNLVIYPDFPADPIIIWKILSSNIYMVYHCLSSAHQSE